jgi:tRNA A37 threonylcarbamoyladenosine modification protein TsaB
MIWKQKTIIPDLNAKNMKPNLIIKVEHPKIYLILKNGEKEVIDEVFWEDKNNLSTKLLAAIDKLLLKNKIKVTQLEKVEVETDQARYTSSRIAQAVAKTVSYCLFI